MAVLNVRSISILTIALPIVNTQKKSSNESDGLSKITSYITPY